MKKLDLKKGMKKLDLKKGMKKLSLVSKKNKSINYFCPNCKHKETAEKQCVLFCDNCSKLMLQEGFSFTRPKPYNPTREQLQKTSYLILKKMEDYNFPQHYVLRKIL